jgi:hypothetical protein
MANLNRPRRGALLCAHFIRNLAYFRAGWNRLQIKFPAVEIWATINSNFLDIAVLEWCKLFADQSAKHGWRKVLVDSSSFLPQLLSDCSVSDVEWAAYIQKMRKYRDEFVAHLDDSSRMDIPEMGVAQKAAIYLYDSIRAENRGTDTLAGLPTSARTYCQECYSEAENLYSRQPYVPSSLARVPTRVPFIDGDR